MHEFHLDETALEQLLRRARDTAPFVSDAVLERARSGHGLNAEEMAVLWFSSFSAETLYDVARTTRDMHPVPLETFAPLYMTNTCDAECLMCGMRRDNDAQRRETAEIEEVERQLRILSRRGMHAVSLLTGEYHTERRPWAIAYVNKALRATQKLGFRHVLINVGSIDAHEYAPLFDGIDRNADGSLRAKLTMCTFQETYSRQQYARFMGTNPNNPRADFKRRLTNFDRAHAEGMRVVNPGILLGLNPSIAWELAALALHSEHLLAKGMEVYLSIPRLRQTAGGKSQGGVNDEDFIRLVAILSIGLLTCKVVLTTRESAAIQRKLVPIVSVLSAGSAAVAPYTEIGARFPLDKSQFEVLDQRPFEAILREWYRPDREIVNFEPHEP